MNRKVSIRLGVLLTAFVVTAWLVFAPSQPQQAWARPTAGQLDGLAQGGRFNELLAQLKTTSLNPEHGTVRSLISDLERFKKNDARRTRQRREAFDEAIAKLKVDAQNDDLEKALIAAVKSHGLADDPDALLRDPLIVNLVRDTIVKANDAKEHNDWLEALALYRALDLLFEKTNIYQDQVDQASQHVRVLQLYAPDTLTRLYDERAKRNGDEPKTDDGPVQPEAEGWQSRLRGVRLAMLHQTLRYAKRKHVARQSYTPLIRGAIDSLIVMLDTQGLDETFPSFKNEANVKQFRDYLARLSASLKEPGKKINIGEAGTIIDRIMRTNQTTVDLPPEVIVFEMTEGMTGALDDFSSVIWPQDREPFSRSTQGNFTGIGVQITRRDGRLIIVSPLENTPAMKAGLKAGDIIAQVDGRKTDTWSLNRAVREITGKRGTPVNIGIERPGEPDLLQYTIIRDKIDIESIRGWRHKPQGGWDYWIDKDSRIGYVRLSQFLPQSADDLDAAISQMQADGPINGLIFDLRFNPGGLLGSAIDICDRFILEGPIVSTVDGNGYHSPAHKAHRLRTYPNFPMTVLINQGSASASEIVSGALQDYHRATIIGTRSFGKGSVQNLYQLHGDNNDDAYLKLTTEYYILPLKRIIHRKPGATQWGIQPDLNVKMTNKQVAHALRLRQEADIIREDGKPVTADLDMPWADEQFRVPGSEPYIKGHKPDGSDRVIVEVQQPVPELLLELGLDAQLEAALLVLKTRLASPHIKMAHVGEAEHVNP